MFFESEHLGNYENNDIFLKVQKFTLRSKRFHFISVIFMFFSTIFVFNMSIYLFTLWLHDIMTQESNSPREDTLPRHIILTLTPRCCVLSGEVWPGESSAIEASTQTIITPRRWNYNFKIQMFSWIELMKFIFW